MTTRQKWVDVLLKIVIPVLEPLSRGRLEAEWTPEYSPLWRTDSDPQCAFIEAFARTMAGVAPWLETDASPDRDMVFDMAVKAFEKSFRPEQWTSKQALVEAAIMCQAFFSCPKLWKALSASTQTQVRNTFHAVAMRTRPYNNNWVLFSVMLDTFLKKPLEKEYLERLESWYVGDGFYTDGPVFHADYYNSFVIHPMLDIVLRHNHMDRGTAVKRMKRYCEVLERQISPDGTFPPIGRSLVYRAGCFHALAYASLMDELPMPRAQVRCALTSCIMRFFDNESCFDDHGYLTLGFAGHQPEIANNYSNSGSAYFTVLVFLPLGLPASHPFWVERDVEWTQKKAWSGKPFPLDNAKT